MMDTKVSFLSEGIGIFTASKDSRPDIRFTADGLGLLVKGLSLDQVGRVDQSLCKARGDVLYVYNPMWPTIRDLWQSITSSDHHDAYGSTEVVKDAFAATITVGISTTYPTHSPKRFGRLDFEEYWQDNTQETEGSTALPAHTSSPLSPASEIRKSRAEQLGYTINFEFAVGHANFRKSFFITRKGYFGIGSEILQAGDLLFIPFGSKTPLAIRQKGASSYWLVGQCYVHGIMSGEAMDEFEAGKSKEEWFEIR
jgi:hypothetical protein